MNWSPNAGEKPIASERVVLDASALLAMIHREPGGSEVAASMSRASISAVNFAEAVSKLVEKKIPLPSLRLRLDDLGMRVHPFTAEMAYEVGELRAETRHLGLSLGDRACLVLARSLTAPALTTDRVWAALDLGVEVRLIR